MRLKALVFCVHTDLMMFGWLGCMWGMYSMYYKVTLSKYNIVSQSKRTFNHTWLIFTQTPCFRRGLNTWSFFVNDFLLVCLFFKFTLLIIDEIMFNEKCCFFLDFFHLPVDSTMLNSMMKFVFLIYIEWNFLF